MKQELIDYYIQFQITDYDDDLIGICKSLVDWGQAIKKEMGSEPLPPNEVPENFYKIQPHHPRMELRFSLRKFLSVAIRQKTDVDEITNLKNIFVCVMASMYVYHLPVEKLLEIIQAETEFTREDAKNVLLEDGMSLNWIKEPSGRDFSKILL
jgi:hypothetical protein